jgi:hypothetical protein
MPVLLRILGIDVHPMTNIIRFVLDALQTILLPPTNWYLDDYVKVSIDTSGNVV